MHVKNVTGNNFVCDFVIKYQNRNFNALLPVLRYLANNNWDILVETVLFEKKKGIRNINSDSDI